MDAGAPPMAPMKTCWQCGADKPLAGFHNSSRAPDGKTSLCKDCIHARYVAKAIERDRRCIECGQLLFSKTATRCKTHAARERGKTSARRSRHTSGYIYLRGHWGHPNADSSGKIVEHVLVMAEHLGRPIRPEETIHHRNGVRDDNRLENLELWSSGHPFGQRVRDKVVAAKRILALYEPDALVVTSAVVGVAS